MPTTRKPETEAVHTPTPWRVEVEEYEENSGQISIEPINRLLHDPDWADPEDWGRDLTNARFIVRAVNSHQALVDALRMCETVLSAMGHGDLAGAISVRAALALADSTPDKSDG